jgi:glycosyltransferase involved in cell wall biosynthesis
VDGGAFPDQSEALDREEPTWDLITVARLAPIKRLDILIRAIAKLRDSGMLLNAVIVGDGTEKRSLEHLVAELGLGERVRFAGFQTDVHNWLSRSRLFVMTSASEGLPLAIIEAMLCGLPVVAPSVGDIPDLLIDEANGFTFAPGDLDSCAHALQKALKPGQLEKCRQRVRSDAQAYTVTGRAPLWMSWLDAQYGDSQTSAESSPDN